MRAMVMTYSRAKVQRQRSVGSEDRVETKGQTEAIALPPSPVRSVNRTTEILALAYKAGNFDVMNGTAIPSFSSVSRGFDGFGRTPPVLSSTAEFTLCYQNI